MTPEEQAVLSEYGKYLVHGRLRELCIAPLAGACFLFLGYALLLLRSRGLESIREKLLFSLCIFNLVSLCAQLVVTAPIMNAYLDLESFISPLPENQLNPMNESRRRSYPLVVTGMWLCSLVEIFNNLVILSWMNAMMSTRHWIYRTTSFLLASAIGVDVVYNSYCSVSYSAWLSYFDAEKSSFLVVGDLVVCYLFFGSNLLFTLYCVHKLWKQSQRLKILGATSGSIVTRQSLVFMVESGMLYCIAGLLSNSLWDLGSLATGLSESGQLIFAASVHSLVWTCAMFKAIHPVLALVAMRLRKSLTAEESYNLCELDCNSRMRNDIT